MAMGSLASQVLYGVFSAIMGAVFYSIFDRSRKRIRLKKALFRELEENLRIIREQIDEVEPIREWNGRASETYHLESYHAIRVNDPLLFFNLKISFPLLIEIYHRLNHLNDVKDATLLSPNSLPDDQQEEYLTELNELEEDIEELLNELERNEFFLRSQNAPIHSLVRTE